ncbi:MAG: CPBP family intramembrane metalloprotease [Clostridiales Family XIII bacterium]|jgi:membrane protease YdiL (CAAX protease family)|nr:CPBP family intramembrane metalloprotease [Clostridiales Family XIII bacterium]
MIHNIPNLVNQEPWPDSADLLRGSVWQHRHDLKRQIMRVVLVLLVAFAIQQTIAAVILMFAVFTNGSFEEFLRSYMSDVMGSGIIDSDLISNEMQALMDLITDYSPNLMGITQLIAVLCSVPAFLALRGKKLFTHDITEQRAHMSGVLLFQIFIIAMGAQFVFTLLSNGLNTLLEPIGFDTTDLYETSVTAMSSPVGMVYIMLIGPIMEEIMFRGAVMKSLERFGGNFAIVMSSLFFGLFHMFTVQAAFAFLVGLLLGYVAHRYSVLWSMLLHILLNSVATGMDSFIPEKELNITFIVLFVVSVCLIIHLRGRIKEQREAGRPFIIAAPPAAEPAYVIGNVPTWEREQEQVAPVQPKLFRIAFSTVSLIVFTVCALGLGVLLMSGVVSM